MKFAFGGGVRGFEGASGIFRPSVAYLTRQIKTKSDMKSTPVNASSKWSNLGISHTGVMATLPKDLLAAAVDKATKAVEQHKKRGGDDEFTNAVGLGAALEAFKEADVVKKWISEVT